MQRHPRRGPAGAPGHARPRGRVVGHDAGGSPGASATAPRPCAPPSPGTTATRCSRSSRASPTTARAGEVRIRELIPATPAGHAALWGFLLDLDLTHEIVWRLAPADEPLVHRLEEARAVETRVGDALWVRLVDLPRALAERAYSAPFEVVLEVADAFCPWNAGRWALRWDGEAATCERTSRPAGLALAAADLGAAYLGGTALDVAGLRRARRGAAGRRAGGGEPRLPGRPRAVLPGDLLMRAGCAGPATGTPPRGDRTRPLRRGQRAGHGQVRDRARPPAAPGAADRPARRVPPGGRRAGRARPDRRPAARRRAEDAALRGVARRHLRRRPRGPRARARGDRRPLPRARRPLRRRAGRRHGLRRTSARPASSSFNARIARQPRPARAVRGVGPPAERRRRSRPRSASRCRSCAARAAPWWRSWPTASAPASTRPSSAGVRRRATSRSTSCPRSPC